MQVLENLAMIILLSLISFGFGGSHVGVATGSAVGAGMINKRIAIIISALGYVVGLILGFNLDFITGISRPMCSLLTSSAFMLWSAISGVPISLTYVIASSNAGCFYYTKDILLPLSKIAELSIWWFIATVLSLILSSALNFLFRYWSSNNPMVKMFIMKSSSIILCFIVAFCIGMNNLAFLSYLTNHQYYLYIIIFSVLGALLLGSQSIITLGYKVYRSKFNSALITLITTSVVTLFATVLRIPISVSYIVTSALLGISISSSPRLIMYGIIIRIFIFQLLSIVMALIVGISISLVIS